MIPGFNVIVENLDYLLWGRAIAGEPGGVLLSLLMAAGAPRLPCPAGLCWHASPGAIPAWCAVRCLRGQS